jgi:predicted transcriptional regulator
MGLPTTLAQNTAAPEFKMSPEALAIAETHLQTLDIHSTAITLGISEEEVSSFLRKPEVKRFMDTVFLETGWRNKHKLAQLLDKIIDEKIEEAEETQLYTNKDLLDVIQLVHKMRMEEIKASKDDGPSTQTNIQVNNTTETSNLTKLIESLIKND